MKTKLFLLSTIICSSIVSTSASALPVQNYAGFQYLVPDHRTAIIQDLEKNKDQIMADTYSEYLLKGVSNKQAKKLAQKEYESLIQGLFTMDKLMRTNGCGSSSSFSTSDLLDSLEQEQRNREDQRSRGTNGS